MNITDLVSPLSSMIPNDLFKHNDIVDNVSSLDTANYDKTDSSLQYKGGDLKRSEKISSENASTEGKITNSESMEMFVDGKR